MATDPHDTITRQVPHLDAAPAGPLMRAVAIAHIVPSLANPRKWFDQAKLQELADSITATGVHQPILLRPLPGERVPETAHYRAQGLPLPEYEIVCGERRYRACQLAAVAEIPAMIRPMTDAQALEAQVIENLQREDVTELEEAEGYRVLMDHQAITAEQVGAKIGKSRAYVYARLKVLDLCEHGKLLLREGKLDFSQALPIARIPNEQLQMEALEQVTDGYYDDEPMSARQVQQLVRDEYMLQLKRAPFAIADATLCPTAGACTTCPNRTGANPDLFADIDSPDVCTNPPCYRAKETAHAAQLRKRAAESGAEIIDEKAARKLLASTGGYLSDYSGIPGYKRLDNANDSPVKGKTLRKLIGAKVLQQSGIKPSVLINPNDGNQLIECVTYAQAEQLLQMAGAGEAEEELTKQREQADVRAAEEAQEKARQEYEAAWRMDVLQRIVKEMQRVEGIYPGREPQQIRSANRLAAERLAGQLNGDDAKLLCKLLDLGKVAPKDAIKQAAAEWNNPELLTGCIIALQDRYSHDIYDWSTGEPVKQTRQSPELMALAEACGVDVEQCKAQVQANARAAAADVDDALYNQALAIVTRDGKASISYVQRKLGIGYNSAARLLDRIQQAGIVGPLDTNGRRELLQPAPSPSSDAQTDPAPEPQPHRPAARAGGERGKAEAKPLRGKARATGALKTTPAEAAAGIAAALQAAEVPLARADENADRGQEPDAAPDGAGEPDPGANAQGNEARSNGTPLTVGGWALISHSHPMLGKRGLLVQLEEAWGNNWNVIDAAGNTLGAIAADLLTPVDKDEHLKAVAAAVYGAPTPGANAPSNGTTNGTPLVVGGWATIAPTYHNAKMHGLLVQLEKETGDAWLVRTQAGDVVAGGIYSVHLEPATAALLSADDQATGSVAQESRHGLPIGATVTVNDTARGPAQKPWVGYTGTAEAYMGERAIAVAFAMGKRKTAHITFDHTELTLQEQQA